MKNQKSRPSNIIANLQVLKDVNTVITHFNWRKSWGKEFPQDKIEQFWKPQDLLNHMMVIKPNHLLYPKLISPLRKTLFYLVLRKTLDSTKKFLEK